MADSVKKKPINTPEIHKTLEKKVTKLPLFSGNQSAPPSSAPPPGYNQGQGQYNTTPVLQQRLDGQPVYVAGGPPQNVSRRGQMFNVRNNSGDVVIRDDDIFTNTFDSIEIRNRFVQRVYIILSIQLFVSFGFVTLGVFEKNVRMFVIQNYIAFSIIGMIVYFVTMMLLVCCQTLRRTVPINFILLIILTLGMTMCLMVITAVAETDAVLFAMGTTALICLLVSLFACQTRWDVTGCGMCLCISMLVLMIFSLIIMILMLCGYYIKWLHIVYSALATLLFCFWLMYDTQLIVGGRHIELSPEEYIYGALTLYVDVVYIFMHILSLFELCR